MGRRRVEPTPELRYHEVRHEDVTYGWDLASTWVLQQRWQDTKTGKLEWRDVPFVKVSR